jgi:hypothetical protein
LQCKTLHLHFFQHWGNARNVYSESFLIMNGEIQTTHVSMRLSLEDWTARTGGGQRSMLNTWSLPGHNRNYFLIADCRGDP